VFDGDALKECSVDKYFNQADNGGFADHATWILTSSFVKSDGDLVGNKRNVQQHVTMKSMAKMESIKLLAS
jgi:hypothetical protein